MTDHFANIPTDSPPQPPSWDSTPVTPPDETTTFTASEFHDHLFHGQGLASWSDYPLQFEGTFDLAAIDWNHFSDIFPDPQDPLTHELNQRAPGAKTEDDFSQTLSPCFNTTVISPEQYVTPAELLGDWAQPHDKSYSPAFNLNQEYYNQALIHSSSLQHREHGFNTPPSISTMSTSALTNSDQGSDHTSNAGHTKSDVTEQSPSNDNSQCKFHCRLPDCNKEFFTLDLLRRHEQRHKKPFQCLICEHKFGAKKDLHRHLWAKYDNTRHEDYARDNSVPCPMRVCPECGKECRDDNLKRHMKSVHGKKRRGRVR